MSSLYNDLLGEFMPKIASEQEVKEVIEGLDLSVDELEALAREVEVSITKEADETDGKESDESAKATDEADQDEQLGAKKAADKEDDKEEEKKEEPKKEESKKEDSEEDSKEDDKEEDEKESEASVVDEMRTLLKEASEAEDELERLAQESAEEILKEAGLTDLFDNSKKLVEGVAQKLQTKFPGAQASQMAEKIVSQAKEIAQKTGKQVGEVVDTLEGKITGAAQNLPFGKKAEEEAEDVEKEAGFADTAKLAKEIAGKLAAGGKMLPVQAEQLAGKIVAKASDIAMKTGKKVEEIAHELAAKVGQANPFGQQKTAREELKEIVKQAIYEKLQ